MLETDWIPIIQQSESYKEFDEIQGLYSDWRLDNDLPEFICPPLGMPFYPSCLSNNWLCKKIEPSNYRTCKFSEFKEFINLSSCQVYSLFSRSYFKDTTTSRWSSWEDAIKWTIKNLKTKTEWYKG